MSSNHKKICLNCGREFLASKSSHPFCSVNCKIRYSNHKGYRCKDCRTADCELRNNYSNITPDKCPNYKWNYKG